MPNYCPLLKNCTHRILISGTSFLDLATQTRKGTDQKEFSHKHYWWNPSQRIFTKFFNDSPSLKPKMGATSLKGQGFNQRELHFGSNNGGFQTLQSPQRTPKFSGKTFPTDEGTLHPPLSQSSGGQALPTLRQPSGGDSMHVFNVVPQQS